MKIKSILKPLLRIVGMDDLLLPAVDPVLTKAEAVESVRAYAAEHGLRFSEPIRVLLEGRFVGSGDTRRHLPVYLVKVGMYRPMPMVEVNALTGEILAWRSLPR